MLFETAEMATWWRVRHGIGRPRVYTAHTMLACEVCAMPACALPAVPTPSHAALMLALDPSQYMSFSTACTLYPQHTPCPPAQDLYESCSGTLALTHFRHSGPCSTFGRSEVQSRGELDLGLCPGSGFGLGLGLGLG